MKGSAIARIILFSILIIVIAGILFAGIGLHFFSFSTKNVITTQDSTVISNNMVAAKDISGIKIDWAAGKIDIVPADVKEIQISESGSGTDAAKITTSGSTLNIEFTEKHSILNLGTDFAKDLQITVPKDWNCSKLEINSASSAIDIREMKISTVEVNTASGECNLADCRVETLKMDAASGKLIFNGMLKELDMDGASASADVTVTNQPKSLKMDSMSGTLRVTLPQDCGFQAKRDSLSGSITCDFDTQQNDGTVTYGDGSCKIKLDGLSSKLEILKGIEHSENWDNK